MDKKEWSMSILMNQYTGLLSHLRAWMRETPCLLCIIGQKICNTEVPRRLAYGVWKGDFLVLQFPECSES